MRRGGFGHGGNVFQKLDEIKGDNHLSRHLEELTGKVRDCKRLNSVEQVTYCEIQLKKEKHSESGETELIGEGDKEEIYNEEHEKHLVICNTSWTLFVDGFDKDSNYFYDQFDDSNGAEKLNEAIDNEPIQKTVIMKERASREMGETFLDGLATSFRES
ncbi:hypothetical protein U9M48_011714 [Paspalum notatum var. saurae]|uniref:Uncharacterized protein n=1 Tax=Paspalum notatum var. saurae TaxID=547442 RepID=A0AAQ3SWE8_PASNO